MLKPIILATSAALITAVPASAAVLVSYNFDADGAAGSDPVVVDPGVTALAFVDGPNSNVANNANNLAININDDTVGFTVSATDPLTVLDLDNLMFDFGGSINSNAPAYEVQAVVSTTVALETFDTGTVSLPSGTGNVQQTTPFMFDLSGPAFQGLSTITFSFAVDNRGTNASNNLARLDNVVLNGDVVPIPEPASAGLVMLGGLCLAARRRR